MPDSVKCDKWERSDLELLDDEQLRAILREDASNQQGEGSDPEMILCAMGILSERRRAQGKGRDTQAAWEAFCNAASPKEKARAVPASIRPNRRLVRKLGVAAAALAVVICSAASVCSWGFEFFNVEGAWTKDVFHFECTNEDEGTGVITRDPDEIRKLLPTWLPEGYVQDEYQFFDINPVSIAVTYVSEDKTIVMGASELDPGSEGTYEKSNGKVEVYTSAGVDYYIFYNIDRLVAVWYTDGYDCFVGGYLSNSEIKMMIDSIQKG